MSSPQGRVSVVMVTRDRRDSALNALGRLRALPESPRIVLVDNGSTDGTVQAVAEHYPDVEVVALPDNLGAAARTAGVQRVQTAYVAFSDDDSWWAPGALDRAARLLDTHPRLAVVAARILLGDDERLEPACVEMAASPLPRDPALPGPALLGFIACGAVVRRSAYLAAGGFHRRLGVGGEEELLAYDLVAAGWSLAYADDVVAHHHPSPVRDRAGRRRTVTRNALWCAWLRRPPMAALGATIRALPMALTDHSSRQGFGQALRGLPWVLRERRRIPAGVEASVRMLANRRDAQKSEGGRMTDEPAGHTASSFTAGLRGENKTGDVRSLAVSVVIPTFRRDETLLRCLEALLRQEFPRDRFEIIVVDDARSETVAPLVARLAERHPDLSWSVLPGLGRGPATARNIGWRAARGEVIAFIDDDAYPADARWLAEGLAPFVDERVVAVSGTVRVPVDEPPTDFQRNVQGLERGEFITCNAFCRRAALNAIGGFDERFTAAYREDSDLQFRLESEGLHLRNPRAAVVHPALPGRFAVSLRLQRYSMYNALLYKKHPARFRRELERQPPLHYYAILAAGGVALAGMVSGWRAPARAAACLWLALTGRFFLRRARGTARRPRHLLDLAITSVLIPPLSIYWRLRGAVRYRVLFL